MGRGTNGTHVERSVTCVVALGGCVTLSTSDLLALLDISLLNDTFLRAVRVLSTCAQLTLDCVRGGAYMRLGSPSMTFNDRS